MGSMSMQEMRRQVQEAYKYSPTWDKKVDRMSDSQVIAVWHRLKEKGVIK